MDGNFAMSLVTQTVIWRSAVPELVIKWKSSAEELVSSTEDLDEESLWILQFADSEPWEIFHTIYAALWVKLEIKFRASSLPPNIFRDSNILEGFTKNAIERISQYTCEEKKAAFELHLVILQLGRSRILQRMPEEWQTMKWSDLIA
jgi:hypothetical protein